MYQDFYELLEKPFSLTPDPKFFFAAEGPAEARELLRYGIREREGFMCFVGPAGTGKTTLLRAALESFGDELVTALILNPFVTDEDLLRSILVDFGINTRDDFESEAGRALSKPQLIARLHDFLLRLHTEGRTAVLVIDEAQNLPMTVMEQIRLLSNLETSKRKLLQIVLAGQMGLRETLRAPELSQLAQRISIRCTLKPFSASELKRYLVHRLRVAGGEDTVQFDEGAVARLHHYTEGVPRLVNLIAERSLLAGYAQQARVIDAALIDRAAESLELAEGPSAAPIERVPPARVAVEKLAAQAAQLRPRQAVAVAALAMVATVSVYAGWQSLTVPDLPGGVSPRAEGSLSASQGSERFGASADEALTPAGPYTVYVSSFRGTDDQRLVEIRDDLNREGIANFVVAADVPAQGRLFRLVVGSYPDQVRAREAASTLRQSYGLEHAEAVMVADVTGSRN